MTVYVMPPRFNLCDLHALCAKMLEIAPQRELRGLKVLPVMLHFGAEGKAYGIRTSKGAAHRVGPLIVEAFDLLDLGGAAMPTMQLEEVGLYCPHLGRLRMSHSLGTRSLSDEIKPLIRKNRGMSAEEVERDEALAERARRIRDTGGRMTGDLRRALTRSVARRQQAEAERA